MRILNVVPAGFRVLMEFELTDLEKLASALECATFVPNRSSAEQGPACKYVKDEFYPELTKFLEDVKGHGS